MTSLSPEKKEEKKKTPEHCDIVRRRVSFYGIPAGTPGGHVSASLAYATLFLLETAAHRISNDLILTRKERKKKTPEHCDTVRRRVSFMAFPQVRRGATCIG